MPRPETFSPVWSLRGDGRVCQPAFSAAALMTATSRGVLHVAQPELDRVDVKRRRHFVHEGFAGEMDLRPDRIAQMRGAQRRGAIEQRRDHLPGRALVGEAVGFRRDAEAVARFQLDAERLAGERIVGLAAIGVDVDARKRLAEKVVGDDVARRIERGARLVDRGRSLRDPSRSPGRAYIARAPACRPPWRARRHPSPHRRRRCGHRSPGPASRSRGRCPPASAEWRRAPRARNAISACRSSR